MSEAKCSCASFERLEGASVPAYIAAFLDEIKDVEEAANVKRFRCRVCRHQWEKHFPQTKSEGTRPTLVRLN